jgi:hypothetical protein
VKPEPRWDVPCPYGYAGAIESMGATAAPLLAGFSVALAVFSIEGRDASRWTSGALFLLIGAALAFIAAVQFTFRARQFAVTPLEIEMWWSDPNEPGRLELLRREQRYYKTKHSRWANAASWAYDGGLLSLLLGVAASLVPPDGPLNASPGRLAAIALALLGFALELLWILRTRLRGAVNAADWPSPQAPSLGVS